jgi:hypothetical protein
VYQLWKGIFSCSRNLQCSFIITLHCYHSRAEAKYYINPSALRVLHLKKFSHLTIVFLMTESVKFHPTMHQILSIMTTMFWRERTKNSSTVSELDYDNKKAQQFIFLFPLTRKNSKHVCRKINIFSLWCLIVSVFCVF